MQDAFRLRGAKIVKFYHSAILASIYFLLFYDFFDLCRCTNRLLPEHKRQESGLSCGGKFKMPGEV